MKGNAITLFVVVVVTMSLTLGTPLFAQQSKQQTTPAVETLKIEPQKQKQSMDPIKKVEPPPKTVPRLPDTTLRLPGPKINEFSCERPASGYYNHTFFLPPTVAPGPEKIKVIFDIFASQGLSKFEITFNGHIVHEEAFGGPPVSSRSARNVMISIQPYKPAASGNYTLQAKVTDRHGESATKSVTLPIDFQAPGLPTIRPAAGDTVYYTAGTEHMEVTFWITSSDDFSGIKDVRVETPDHVYRGSDTTSPYSITVRNVLISDADEWNIHITDNAGNTRSVLAHTINVAPRRASLPATRP